MNIANSWATYIIPFSLMAGILLFPCIIWLCNKTYKENEQ